MPRGLTLVPTNGPEDFQELAFKVFQRRLYKDWFLFVDDLSVATGRKKCHGDGPSGAHDVSCVVRDATEGEKGAGCLNKKSGQAFPSPFAHLATQAIGVLARSVLVFCYFVSLFLTCSKGPRFLKVRYRRNFSSNYFLAASALALGLGSSGTAARSLPGRLEIAMASHGRRWGSCRSSWMEWSMRV